MATRMQQRRGTSAQWTSANPVLAAGEIGFETDTNQFKMGDGVNTWTNLTYFVDADGVSGSLGDYVELALLGVADGVATLDSNGYVPASQLDIDLTGYATEAYVTTAVSNLIDAAPAALDTLNELAAAINDDANFFTTITNSIATKQDDVITTRGDLVIGNGTGTPERLPVGAADQILSTDGTDVYWADLSGGVAITGTTPGQVTLDAGISQDTYSYTPSSNGTSIVFYNKNGCFVKRPDNTYYAPIDPINQYSSSRPDFYSSNPYFTAGQTYEITAGQLSSGFNNPYGIYPNMTNTSSPSGGSISYLAGFDAGLGRYWGSYYDGGYITCYSDDNGLTWTQSISHPNSNSDYDIQGDSSISNLVMYTPGNASSNAYFTSSNGGNSWTQRTAPNGDTWSKIIWDGTKFVGTSYTYSGYSRYIFTSTDGISWTLRHSINSGDSSLRNQNLVWNGLTGASSKFLLHVEFVNTNNFTGMQAYSLDGGVTWTNSARIDAYIGQIAGNNGYFVAGYGVSGTQPSTSLYYTTDPSQGWTQVDTTGGAGIGRYRFGASSAAPNYQNDYNLNSAVGFGNGFVLQQYGRVVVNSQAQTVNIYIYTEDFATFEVVSMGDQYNLWQRHRRYADPFVDPSNVFYNYNFAMPNGQFKNVYTPWATFTTNPEFNTLN